MKLCIAMVILAYTVGCAPIATIVGYKTVTAASEERSVKSAFSDAVIIAKIKEALYHKEVNHLFISVSVFCHEGRVLLTGSVSDYKYVIEAVKIAWRIKGVIEVINEVEINTKTLKTKWLDICIANSIRTKLFLNQEIQSRNYTVDVNNGKVYLIGIAQNHVELDLALEVTSKTNGVKKVVSYMTFREDLRRINDL